MTLRISINSERREGAHGGANRFTETVETGLESRGHDVYRTLAPDLDVILIVNPNPTSPMASYDLRDAEDYTLLNPETSTVLRVNTCDEARGERLGNNEAMLETAPRADHLVFVSEFLRDTFAAKGMDTSGRSRVIRNGSREDTFTAEGRADWSPGDPIRIVTHHWSPNFMKGHDVYKRLDLLLDQEPYCDDFEFTYVGNRPLGVEYENARVVEPLSGDDLVAELQSHHAYVTASRNEAGPNHVLEGLQCGLPMLYLDSGALPEYCHPYGVEFDLTNFEESLLELRDEYARLREAVLAAETGADRMVSEYAALFEDLVAARRSEALPRPSLGDHLRVRLLSPPARRLGRLFQLGRYGWRYYKRELR